MRPQERDVQLAAAMLKDEPQRKGPPAFEKFAAELADSKPGVTVWLSERVR